MGLDEALCSKCGQAAQFKCERCLEPYCSSQCQVNDWHDHKSKCYKFPNLVPINMLKSVSNLHLDKIGGNQRRHHGSVSNLNETRRPNTPVNVNYNKAKPKPLLNDDDFNMVPKASSPVSAIKTISERTITWREPFPPSEGFFDALVQFREEDESEKRIVWVTDLKYDSPLRKLLSEINRTINQQYPCSNDDVYQGALVAAPLEKMLYRAEVLDTCADKQKATVRLIDYGNELRVPYSQLFAPIPIMCNLNAYAFRVSLPKDYGPVEIETIVTLRIMGEKQPEGYYNVECKMKSISLNLPLELFNKEPVLKFVKCFSDGRNALLQLCSGGGVDDQEFNSLLNSPQSLTFEYESLPSIGAFVAARTQSGWKRARLLGFYEKQHQFLIYAIDEGFIRLSPQIKKVPESFIIQPIRVFAVSTSSTDCMISETMLSTAKKLTLQLLPASSSSVKDCKTQLSCGLFDDNRKIVDVVTASVFTGSFNELGVKLWFEPIPEGDTVVISYVLSYKEIYIASQQNSEYFKILMAEYSKCIPFTADEKIEINDVVMYYIKEGDETQYCRGQIIKCESNILKVMNTDSGSHQVIARNVIRKPTIFAFSLPVRCFRVALTYLENIPTPIANNKALEALESCMQNVVEFDVTYSENRSVDLLFRTKEKQSLCKKLLPLVFEAATQETITSSVTKLPENTSLPLSPPNTPIVRQPSTTISTQDNNASQVLDEAAVKDKIFTMNDLEIIPISCGEKVPLYVLDPSTIQNADGPYITAGDYNKEILAKMEQYLKSVAIYCKSDKALRNGYSPKKMEICLSVFADDGEWYRALCVDHKPNDTFVVMFLDYGNMAKVNKKDLMPITQDLMFPANANMVYLEGITNKEQALAFIKIIEKNPVIYANVRRLADADAYIAKICF